MKKIIADNLKRSDGRSIDDDEIKILMENMDDELIRKLYKGAER